MNMLLVSGAEDPGAESGGEGDHPGVRSAGIGGIEIGTEKETAKGSGNVSEIDTERGKEKGGPGAREGRLQKGNCREAGDVINAHHISVLLVVRHAPVARAVAAVQLVVAAGRVAATRPVPPVVVAVVQPVAPRNNQLLKRANKMEYVMCVIVVCYISYSQGYLSLCSKSTRLNLIHVICDGKIL